MSVSTGVANSVSCKDIDSMFLVCSLRMHYTEKKYQLMSLSRQWNMAVERLSCTVCVGDQSTDAPCGIDICAFWYLKRAWLEHITINFWLHFSNSIRNSTKKLTKHPSTLYVRPSSQSEGVREVTALFPIFEAECQRYAEC